MIRICLYSSPVKTEDFLRRVGISASPLTGEYGKPALPGTGFYFNKSDSGSLTAYVLSDEGEVGIDLQKILPYKERYDRLAGRFFRPEEAEALSRMEEKEKAGAFFRLWTVKESYLKYTGRGIGGGLSSFRVDLRRGLILPDTGEWAACRILEGPALHAEGYVLAVCARKLPDFLPILYDSANL